MLVLLGVSQQKLDNISDAVIAEYYSRIQSEGFNTLSYWNVFEFGQDIVYVLSDAVLC